MKDLPEWANNELYIKTISGGYLCNNETPKEAYRRIAKAAASYKPELNLEEKFFNILWKGWLIPSSPVMSNLGTHRGLPISCFSSVVDDTMLDIFDKIKEMAILSQQGGGTAYNLSKVRGKGSPISRGGYSEGTIPFIKVFDSAILASKQSDIRRGATAIYMDAYHKDYSDFLQIREPKGDSNRQCHNIHHSGIFTNEFMKNVIDGNKYERELWIETIRKRVKTGEPYITFIDNAKGSKRVQNVYTKYNVPVNQSNLCNEIFQPTDKDHTLVCCLSSLNLDKYDEWKNTDTIQLATYFLDSVIEEFILKGNKIKGLERAVKFATKSRSIGLGVMGWHTYLQKRNIPFVGIQANSHTRIVFGNIKEQTEIASKYLASKYGEPLWCKNSEFRNLTLIALPPTRSSALLAGGVSQGIEPIGANIYVDGSAKSTFIRKNKLLESLLESINKNTSDVWLSIQNNRGSVQHLDFLDDYTKEVFKTFREINQLELVKQAGIRQEYIDQGQSLNLRFSYDAPAKFINKVHITAWKLGLKGLYYLRSESSISADKSLYSDCISCEG